MKLSHLSASSLKTWLACPMQWFDRYGNGFRGQSNDAADLGSLVHDVLEGHVKDGDHLAADSWDRLYARWHNACDLKRNQSAVGDGRYEGMKMLQTWHNRQDWDGIQVVSTETEYSFPLKTKYGEVPFVYIIDRVDRRKQRFEVIDYKSGRFQLNHDQLRQDPQALSYATAMWLEVPEQPLYHVTFDYLRDQPIGVGFRAEDCKDWYAQLVAWAEQIIETDEADAEERINAGCRFCHRKLGCETVTRLGDASALTMATEDLVGKRVELEFGVKALQQAIKEIDSTLIASFEDDDTLPALWSKKTTGAGKKLGVMLGAGKGRRSVDMAAVHAIVDDSDLLDYAKLNLADLNELADQFEADGDPITGDKLRRATRRTRSKASIKVIEEGEEP